MKALPLMLTAALACACGDDSPSPAVSSSSTSGSTSSTADTTTDAYPTTTDESTGSGPPTEPMPCLHNEDCPDDAPFCDPGGECAKCYQVKDGGAACREQDPGKPLCWGQRCVACTASQPEVCKEQLLLCDAETNACVGCTEHDECESGACDVFDGRCFDPDTAILHVGSGEASETIGDALDAVGIVGVGRAVLVLHEGATFNEAVTVDSGAVAFVAAEGESPSWVRTGIPTAPTLTVSGAETRVYVAGVLMRSNNSSTDPALLVDGGRVEVRRSRIVQNTGGGVLAENGAELVLRNCFVGGAALDVDAISASDAMIDLLYTTVGGGAVAGARSRALFCDKATVAIVRNSILVSLDPMPEVECSGATFTTSATEADIGVLDIDWFGGYAGGDFSLTTMGGAPGAPLFQDIAQWQDGDPATDIDGDARPTVDATPDYAGADVPL